MKLRADLLSQLTAREQTVSVYVVMGLTNAAIARTIESTENSVKQLCQSIYTKLGVESKLQLAVMLVVPPVSLSTELS